MSTLPANLPDARTAQRLLDILAQLEQTLRMGRQSGNTEVNNRLANLQFENQRLRTSRELAAQRLTLLMERLQQQLDADTESAATAMDTAAILATMQDTAA
jgi:ABC-type transport system involved in Fe-S cluster assembly fused permease/ATPase subunit